MPVKPLSIWHPFTQEALDPQPVHISRGEGVYLYTRDGRKLIDAISSWWVNLHGHAHPLIAEAIAEQARKLEHVIFAGFTHDAAEERRVLDEAIERVIGRRGMRRCPLVPARAVELQTALHAAKVPRSARERAGSARGCPEGLAAPAQHERAVGDESVLDREVP